MAMTVEEFDAQKMVFKYGETGHKFYIILEGKVGVLIPERVRVEPEVTEARIADVDYLRGVIKRITLRIERLVERVDKIKSINDIFKKELYELKQRDLEQ